MLKLMTLPQGEAFGDTLSLYAFSRAQRENPGKQKLKIRNNIIKKVINSC